MARSLSAAVRRGTLHRAFGHRQDVASEANVPEILDKPGVVITHLRELSQILLFVSKCADEVECELETCNEQECAATRCATRVQVEGRDTDAIASPGDVRRVWVVEIRQKTS